MADPLGVRNFNPGNIRVGAGFDGETEGEGGFAAFPDAASGGTALIKNLVAYNTKHGIDTISGIVGRWAPSSENNTAAYTQALSDYTGFNANDKLNMQDPGVLAKLAGGIAQHEGNGGVYSQDFFDALAGKNPELTTYIASSKMPTFSKNQARTAAYHANPSAPGEPGMNVNDMSAIDRVWGGDPVTEEAAALQSGREIASQTRWAGFGEALADAIGNNTVTGTLYDMTKRGEVDPNFKIGDEQKQAMGAAGILSNEQLTSFVQGAYNADDFQRRVEIAQERADFFQRASNTMGLQFAGVQAGQLVGGAADPVALIATFGLGAAASAARAGFATTELSNAARIAAGAAGGAAGNMGVSEFVNRANNQEFSWHELLSQGIAGAALGALGHVLTAREAAGRPSPEVDPIADAAGANAHAVVESRANAAMAPSGDAALEPSSDGSVPTSALDIPHNPAMPAVVQPELDTTSLSREAVRTKARPEPVEQTGTGSNSPAPEEMPTLSKDSIAAGLGYTPEATLAGDDYRALHDSGVVLELRSADDLAKASPFQRKYGEAVPADAKALYSPQDDRVYVFRDRITPEEASDPRGLIMHEVGVHYGLERAIGTERFTSLLKAVEESEHPLAKAARDAVPADTPSYLKAEEALGYLVENHAGEGFVSKMIATIRNWLRANVGAFRNLNVSPSDVAQLVRGSVEKVKREGKLSADATFPYVWHGSPVRGIEKLDLKYAGTGEGNAAYGYGHYVTSEKGTALDYRNKESARRGIQHDEGGLYRLKVNTTQDKLLDWDKRLADQPAVQVVVGRDLGEGATGKDAYAALARDLGSQKAASEALDNAGVHGLRYTTGRSRDADVQNSNYVLFNDRHLDISNRYSRTGEKVELRRSTREAAITKAAREWDESVTPDTQKQRDGLKKWREMRPDAIKGAEQWLDSPGLLLQSDKSKVARYIGAHLFEDGSGYGKRVASTVALDYERLQTDYKWAALPQLQSNLVKGFTPWEKAQYMMGGAKTAEARVWREVQVERLQRRAAIASGAKRESVAPDHIVQMANALDGFYDKVTSDGKAAGVKYAENIRGAGYVGHIPYQWSWERMGEAYRNDPARFKAVHDNLTQQYTERLVDPAIEALRDAGPQQPEVLAKTQSRLSDQVSRMVDQKLSYLLENPAARVDNLENHFETLADDLLKENFEGKGVDDIGDEFKKLLGEKIKDRKRTELDLLRDVNSVQLLDFIDHNGERMVAQGSHRFAGFTAMAKKGFYDLADTEAAKSAALKDGASPEAMQALDFGFRAFGFGQLRNAERASFTAMRNFTYAATMGKLGLSVLADASNVMAASGVGGFLRAVGGIVGRKSEFLKQLAVDAPGLLGQDYRLHSLSPDVTATGRVMMGEGSTLTRVSQRASQMVSWLNGSNFIQGMLHRGFLPVFAEDMLRTIHGENGGMTVARLADVGVDADMMVRIKGQLDQFDAGRARGDKVNWDSWKDQEAADALINAMHRGTFQVFQRAMVGEAPMWLTESSMGSLFGQFRRYGIVSTEKQLARNVAIGDMNTINAFVFGTAWAAMLYYARLHLNAIGKSDADAKKYLDDNTKGFRLASGVFTLMNMSGLLPDTINLGELVFGGKSTMQAGSPVASMGYLGDLAGAAHAIGNRARAAAGVDTDTPAGSDYKKLLRIVPGGNSLIGTYWANQIATGK